jgi:hypothetical protein
MKMITSASPPPTAIPSQPDFRFFAASKPDLPACVRRGRQPEADERVTHRQLEVRQGNAWIAAAAGEACVARAKNHAAPEDEFSAHFGSGLKFLLSR